MRWFSWSLVARCYVILPETSDYILLRVRFAFLSGKSKHAIKYLQLPKEEEREKSPLIRWKPMIYPFLSKNVYFQSISPVNRWEIMSSEYNKEAVPMKYQQHGCHSKTCAMTTPISMPRWMGEISWGPTPRWSYNQQLLIEKESVFLSDDAPHRYPVPVVISKHRYIRKTLDKLRRL